MKLSVLRPRAELAPFIQSIWAFEGERGLPESDVSLAAPNGSPKLVLTLENSLVSSAGGQARETGERTLSIVGIRSLPVTLSTRARKTSFVGIELRPAAAFPIFGVPMDELANRLLPADGISRLLGGSFADQVWTQEGIPAKVDLVQRRLVAAVAGGPPRSPVIEYCVDCLRKTNGTAAMSDLEERTGYGKRTLQLLFKRYVGISPKALARIFRFQWFYRRLASGEPYEAVTEDLYELFYDQSHFANEFKRMTGFSPLGYFRNVSNEFGRRVTLSHP